MTLSSNDQERSADSTDEKRGRIKTMFGAIAGRYDLLNTILSFGQDRRWRKSSLRRLGLERGDLLVDIAGGTGDVALTAAKLQPRLGAALVLDFSEPMLRMVQPKREHSRIRPAVIPIAADAVSLPLPGGCADAVTIAFGIRNVVDVPAALGEMNRILKPGGKLLILEFAVPRGRLFGPVFRWYFMRVLPWIGGLVSGSRAAYEYLPRSVDEFFKPEEMVGLMRGAGFNTIVTKRYNFGVVVTYNGEKSV
ncbi:MAG TPA: ubiquinone/menaquinone biosynthesis methyltransferase [Acidobacteriota bacterium]|nr:ubiquinone/menaquinone biosynthesis methyltransferase [Acidobacteriota bacterium]